MKSYNAEKCRQMILRAAEGDVLPGDLARALADEVVACGWVRASGVLVDVDLRAYDADAERLGAPRRIAGPVQALTLEGSVGFDRGEVSVGLRAVLARETDRGLEVLAGELVGAKVVALEAYVTAFDDLALARVVDERAGVALLTDPAAPVAGAAPRPAARAPEAPSTAAWSDAVAASAEADAARPAARVGALGGAIPPRPLRPQSVQEETLVPDANDTVEHFAFGTCEVLKSEGDRLFLRVGGKDGRIKEIALEMLRVTPLPSTGEHRRFKLDRKL